MLEELSSPLEVCEINHSLVTGFVVLDSLNNDMAFGGCRFSAQLTKDEVLRLARCMTKKFAIHGSPVGGAKGGVKVDPKDPDLFKKLKIFAEGAKEILQSKVVIGKDLGATNEMLDYIYECAGVPQLHVVKNKFGSSVPNQLRSFTGYIPHMTGQGVAWAAEAALETGLREQRVLIQGAGAVGLGTAFRMIELGATILGICDKDHFLYDPEGLSWDFLNKVIHGGEIKVNLLPPLARERLLKTRAIYTHSSDVFVLAASSNSVDLSESETLKTKLVVEGSNFGLTSRARKNLADRGIWMVPDFISSSSSGAMVGLQMASGNSNPHEILWKQIKKSIQNATRMHLNLPK